MLAGGLVLTDTWPAFFHVSLGTIYRAALTESQKSELRDDMKKCLKEHGI
jgi:hypothetical protein